MDHYFSDDNLLTDRYLLGKMKGSKNNPVLLGSILSFRKMEKLRPADAVAEACKSCELVNVLEQEGKWYVQRKEPFTLLHEKKKIPKVSLRLQKMSVLSELMGNPADWLRTKLC